MDLGYRFSQIRDFPDLSSQIRDLRLKILDLGSQISDLSSWIRGSRFKISDLRSQMMIRSSFWTSDPRFEDWIEIWRSILARDDDPEMDSRVRIELRG